MHHKTGLLVCSTLLAVAGSTAALGASSGLPFTNMQPSLAVTEVTMATGIYPTQGGSGSAVGDMLGFVYDFAGNFAPGGGISSQGQLLPIAQNTALFSLLGINYGGDGKTTFALPNLAGQATIGAGVGAGLSPRLLGVATGSATTTLTSAQMPAPQGGNQPFSNLQPSTALTPLIATAGAFPSQDGNSGSASFLGQIAYFTGNFAPSGWTLANGQLLSIQQNQSLFAIVGTMYGGDGKTTFALPDLQGRAAVGATGASPVGTAFGTESTLLTAAQIQGAPFSNVQPSLAVNYLIATYGLFPTQGGNSGGFNSTLPTLGEITAFAGNYVPSGWALANGQLLSIEQNSSLFTLVGTMYGGDGITTFALPDLQGRTVIGADNVGTLVGQVMGVDQITLAAANIPAVPEPETYAMMMAGLALLGFMARRRKVNLR
jgi:microcystin-dependent protein